MRFAPPLFRQALMAHLNLRRSDQTALLSNDSKAIAGVIVDRMRFANAQKLAEDAILVADAEPDEAEPWSKCRGGTSFPFGAN
jgi:hypothetical protein